MTILPIHHIVRIRRSEDLTFVRGGVLDEVLINANHVENSPDSTATAIREAGVPFSIDPMLTRFQFPDWWHNERGEEKRNYKRLGAAYVKGTSIRLPAGPLVAEVSSNRDWCQLAANVVAYQETRITRIPAQLDLFGERSSRELSPARVMAPALVALSEAEDRVNGVMATAAVDAATRPVSVPVIVPPGRLADRSELDRLVRTLPEYGVASYFIWTPGITEERLLADHNLFLGLVYLVTELAERGVPVGHLHATYAVAALHEAGVAAVVHHLGWVDKGEPAGETGGGPRSCRTYVPSVRQCLRFEEADVLGRSLDGDTYAERYCGCNFCSGAFAAGQHPLDLLLERQPLSTGDRHTPTSRAVAFNTWHYLLSRRQEIEAFSGESAADVIARDIRRAAAAANRAGTARLARLADELRSA